MRRVNGKMTTDNRRRDMDRQDEFDAIRMGVEHAMAAQEGSKTA